MRCTYRYERKHIMNGPEVAAFYYEHKQNLIDGKEDLSDGDYYNLFDVIEDPGIRKSLPDLLTDM